MNYRDNPYRDNPPKVSPAVLVGAALLAVGAVVVYSRQSSSKSTGDSDIGNGGNGGSETPGGLGSGPGKRPPIKNVEMVFIGRPFSEEIVLNSLREVVSNRAQSKLADLNSNDVLASALMEVVNDTLNDIVKGFPLAGTIRAQLRSTATSHVNEQVRKLRSQNVDIAGNAQNAAVAVALNAASRLEYPPQLTEDFAMRFSSAVEIALFNMLMTAKPRMVSTVVSNILPSKIPGGAVLPKKYRDRFRSSLTKNLWNKLNEIAPNTAFQGVGALALERAVA